MTGITNAQAVSLPRMTSGRAAVRALALAAAVLFVLHGIAHAVGFAGTFGLSGSKAIEDGYTLVSGLDSDGLATYALGFLWIVPIPLFVIAAAGLVLRRTWWLGWTFAATLVSLVPCILWLEPAKVGLVLNVAILTGLTVYALVARKHAQ